MECGSGFTNCDSDDTGYKLYAGYKITPNIAVEAGYIDFGKATATLGGAKGELKNSAPFIVGLYRGAFTPSLSGVARLGVANVESELDLGAFGSQSETKIQAIVGLGLEYAFTKQFKGTVDFDATSTNEVEKYPVRATSGSIYMISIGAQYNF
jgi:OOP family OmpA-OmpF porin